MHSLKDMRVVGVKEWEVTVDYIITRKSVSIPTLDVVKDPGMSLIFSLERKIVSSHRGRTSLESNIGAITLVILMIGAPAVYAEQFGHQYYWGWRDGYYHVGVFCTKAHAFSWPNDDEGHPPNYWKGVDAGMKYAQEHVMVKVIRGHVLTEYNATTRITDWFDGQNAHLWGVQYLG